MSAEDECSQCHGSGNEPVNGDDDGGTDRCSECGGSGQGSMQEFVATPSELAAWDAAYVVATETSASLPAELVADGFIGDRRKAIREKVALDYELPMWERVYIAAIRNGIHSGLRKRVADRFVDERRKRAITSTAKRLAGVV